MKYFLAIDWDHHEARYVLASIRGKTVKVRAASSARVVDVTEGVGEPRYSFGSALTDVLAEHKVSRAKLLVAVPRGSVELLHFTIPPAKDPELPELVTNLTIREAPNVSEQWSLDFVPLDDDPEVQRRVMVAALSPNERDQIQQLCSAAGLRPSRLLLRALTSASLLSASPHAADEVCLLVNHLGREAALSVVAEDRTIFSRTVRLPETADEDEVTERLLAEIKRTLAALPRDLIGEEEIDSICVFGGTGDHEQLVQRATEEVSVPARVVDPFAAIGSAPSDVPEDRGRFAPLVGMLLDEARGTHAIDFLTPRRPPRTASPLRIGMFTGAAAAAVALVVTFHVWSTLSSVNSTNRDLMQQREQAKITAKKAAKRLELISAIEDWKGREVNWLDELRDLSIRFPGARDAVLLRMSVRPSQSSDGVIDIDGLVRDPKIVRQMESLLHDPYRRVQSKQVRVRSIEQDYTWYFDAAMSVAGRRKDRYVSHLPDESGTDAEPEAALTSDESAAIGEEN